MQSFSQPPTTAFTAAEYSVLRTLAYFDIFKFPLKKQELVKYSAFLMDESLLGQGIAALIQRKLVTNSDEYFALSAEIESLINRRLHYESIADEAMPIAQKMATLIGRFPFVQAVCISGSLSKSVMAPDGDVDFFIVTTPKRLWLARTMLVLYKKIMLRNSHKYFCINYFVDTEHLEIDEKNIFTATELATLLPMVGSEWYGRLHAANPWVEGFYPQCPHRSVESVSDAGQPWQKRVLEWLFSGWIGSLLDRFCMNFTVGFWRKKFKSFDEDTFSVAIKSKRTVSKHHPQHFQRQVLEKLQAKMNELNVIGERAMP